MFLSNFRTASTAHSHKSPKPSLAERIAIRRHRGCGPEAIGVYAYQLSQHMARSELFGLLTAEEQIECQKAEARAWVASQVKKAKVFAAEKKTRNEQVSRENLRKFLQPFVDSDQREKDKLKHAGAMSRKQVAKTLGIRPSKVEYLRRIGILKPDGFISIQYSYGRRCYVWTLETVMRYMTKSIALKDQA